MGNRWWRAGALIAMWTVAAGAQAQADAVNEVIAISSPKLALHARPDAASKVAELPREEVALPLKVLDSDENERFFRVELGGRSVWLKRAQVDVTRGVVTGCLVQTKLKESGGVIRGANQGCRK